MELTNIIDISTNPEWIPSKNYNKNLHCLNRVLSVHCAVDCLSLTFFSPLAWHDFGSVTLRHGRLVRPVLKLDHELLLMLNLFIQFNARQPAKAHKSMLQNMQRLHSTPSRPPAPLVRSDYATWHAQNIRTTLSPLATGIQNSIPPSPPSVCKSLY